MFLGVVVASNNVWKDISFELNNCMSKNALHVFVYKGYYGIKEKLGLTHVELSDAISSKSTIHTNLDQSDG